MIAATWLTTTAAVLLGVLVEVVKLDGETMTGELQSLNQRSLAIQPAGQAAPVPIDLPGVLEIRFPGSLPASPVAGLVRVQLWDDTVLYCQEVTTQKSVATLMHASLGSITVPTAALQSVRFAPADARVDATWNDLVDRAARKDMATKKDMVVVRKQDALDHLDGVISQVRDSSTQFLLDGDDIAIKREKIFGLIYSRKSAAQSASLLKATLVSGEVVSVTTAELLNGQLALKLPGGSIINVEPGGLASLDYSAGKVRYLSSISPKDVRYTPFLDFTWEYVRDRSFDGKPLEVGNKTYSRGLAIHSKTNLKYRLSGEFSRFQAIAAIDDSIRVKSVLLLRVLADDKELFASEIDVDNAPVRLDLPIAGASELEIIVDYGGDQIDIGDRLHLADAKLVK